MEQKFRAADSDTPEACVVAEIMMEEIQNDNSTTMSELNRKLRNVIDHLKMMSNGVIRSSVAELFLRHVSLNSAAHNEIDECRKTMLERGFEFRERIKSSRKKIANLCHPFILDGSTVLTHAHSRVALEVFKKAAAENKHFQVYVTESRPDYSGNKMRKLLEEAGVPCNVILDAEIGYYIENVDIVLVGAESVVESGGIINKIGSYPLAICARQLNKPFYVLAESFKFARLYPLNQEDLRNELKDSTTSHEVNDSPKGDHHHPILKDYTPPSYISLLFTDLGILTPSAVSDELIKIYT